MAGARPDSESGRNAASAGQESPDARMTDAGSKDARLADARSTGPKTTGPKTTRPQGPAARSGTPRARRITDTIPLSTKLAACTLILLLIGAAAISLTIRELVGNYMLEKTDAQLVNQAQLVYDNVDVLRSKDGDGASPGPSDYFMQIRDMDDAIVVTPLVPTLPNGVVSQPLLPANRSMAGVRIGRPFTTPAVVKTASGSNPDRSTVQVAHAPWRVLVVRLVQKVDGDTTENRGLVYIGLSLSDQIDTINTLTRYCAMVGLAIVLLGGAMATLLIQHTLTPLKRIEKTAAKIAAGDLSQRVPSAPENTEVGSLAASLNAMLARIEGSFHEQQQTTEKMKRFVSDASHELRTPLATIHGYSELYTMQRDMPGALERADESIAHIEASSSRMTVLVEDLLSLARLDEGRGIDITQQVAVRPLIADAADDLHALDPERTIRRGAVLLDESGRNSTPRLRFREGPMPDIEINGDGSRLRQVITNIVGNIHRYTPGDSPVEVALGMVPASIGPESLARMPSTERSMHRFLEAAEVGRSMQVGMNYAVIRFIDHGPGVPVASQAQIFERFYTADPSRARQKGGTGLGMSIAQSVVKAHRGFICASSSDGGGLTLTVILPVGPLEPVGVARQQTKVSTKGDRRGRKSRRS
ncbi:MAG: ATP-binding protein [Bifidobacterium mongoliense]|nr:ATP-binding protein [Bifidobacterium mongoliense]